MADISPCQPSLDPRIPWRKSIGALQEAHRSIDIADFERRLPGIDQRRNIARIAAQLPQCHVELQAPAAGNLLDYRRRDVIDVIALSGSLRRSRQHHRHSAAQHTT